MEHRDNMGLQATLKGKELKRRPEGPEMLNSVKSGVHESEEVIEDNERNVGDAKKNRKGMHYTKIVKRVRWDDWKD